MPHTYQELRHKTVAELRDMAKGVQHEAVQGIDKAAIKAKVRQLKSERDRALDTHDHPSLKNIRRQMHALIHQIRAHMS